MRLALEANGWRAFRPRSGIRNSWTRTREAQPPPRNESARTKFSRRASGGPRCGVHRLPRQNMREGRFNRYSVDRISPRNVGNSSQLRALHRSARSKPARRPPGRRRSSRIERMSYVDMSGYAGVCRPVLDVIIVGAPRGPARSPRERIAGTPRRAATPLPGHRGADVGRDLQSL